MDNPEVFLKFDPRYGEAETLDRRVFDSALEFYAYMHGKRLEEMSKKDAYNALLEYRDYSHREHYRWTYIEHKIRSLMHDTNAWTTEAPEIRGLAHDTIDDVPIETQFEVFTRDNFACRYCGVEGSKEELEIDFITPTKDGGNVELDNLVSACVNCKNKVHMSRARSKKKTQ